MQVCGWLAQGCSFKSLFRGSSQACQADIFCQNLALEFSCQCQSWTLTTRNPKLTITAVKAGPKNTFLVPLTKCISNCHGNYIWSWSSKCSLFATLSNFVLHWLSKKYCPIVSETAKSYIVRWKPTGNKIEMFPTHIL